MLSDLVKTEYIQLKTHANNWEQAVRIAAQPLLEDGCFDNTYVSKIIEIAKDLGPYIVIAKNIALPHAPSKFGVKKLGIGVTTLDTPVTFGNQANDPVIYLFCLSAPNGDDHIKALQELTVLLTDETFFRLLDQSNNPNEILNYIKETGN
ncbi:PTS sugar transporter subunit IIA [Sporolactobacillus terrae]|uniref:PTS sugar transporter subunit IIA n=1 Tax=Sporolactobacillus terrae TaxID=269673 RepID=UPI00111AB0CF|nr:PTS sugar transporter subunit IIA [Sporolactobacillus terrae]UAK16399.1 PTS sugar transporter subunit IIA [Sporolactobacillus terrae]